MAGQTIDGCRLVRPIGQGGFGTVWLCWSETSKSYHALKWVTGEAGALEQDALIKFRRVSQRLRSPNLISIEHINRLPSALIYTLPLADGAGADDPADEAWHPQTLAERIDGRQSPWFSSSEILDIILPIINVVASLNEEGLVHRDIKPANILFFDGVPCLADMGLLSNDTASLTQRGTPGFLAPSWFLESSGQPDMWGLATTLYTLLTGNHPDKMGRVAFLWPPEGKEFLSASEQVEWQRLHSVIYRATHEKQSERFRDFRAFEAAVNGIALPDRRKTRMIPALVAAAFLGAGVIAWLVFTKVSPDKVSPEIPIVLPSGVPTTSPRIHVPGEAKNSTGMQKALPTGLLEKDAQSIIARMDAEAAKMLASRDSYFNRAAEIREKMKNADGGIVSLESIREDLIKLREVEPKETIQQWFDEVSSLYTTLIAEACAKTATADDKLYFKDKIQPGLDDDFFQMFGAKPGEKIYDKVPVSLYDAQKHLS